MRKLRKCKGCGQWFNTTDAIMIRHYVTHHGDRITKPMAYAEAMVSAIAMLNQARFGLVAPYTAVAAAAAAFQAAMVIAASVPRERE